MDEATAMLVRQLQLEDLQELAKNAKGKKRADEPDDLQLAMSCYETELQALQALVKDREMGSSIANAVRDDAALIAEWKAQETQAAQDRSLALHWRDGGATRPANVPRSAPTNDEPKGEKSDDELVAKLSELYMFGSGPATLHDEGDETGTQPESSAWAASRTSGSSESDPGILDTRVCVSCLNNYPLCNVVSAPCSHEYCRRCLVKLFTQSITDESLFPPRCCREAIPVNQATQLFLPAKLVGEFEAKKVERETPNPTYCHRPNCSAFIPLQFVKGDVGTCVKCSAATCTICKAASHRGDCPEDTTTNEVLRIAAENEWQRCPSCHRLVELQTGCHHITCLCRAQFCYVCAARWKTCECPQWQEERLLERAETVVDRRGQGRDIPAEERAQRVQRAARQLRWDHECEHDRWTRIDGPRDCEQCNQTMPIWVNECRQCHIMVCRRCKYNRLG